MEATTMLVNWNEVKRGVKAGLKGFGLVLIPWLVFINGV